MSQKTLLSEINIDHLSYSTFAIPCPRAVIKKLRGDKYETPISDEAETGKTIHEALMEYLQTGKADMLKETLPYSWERVKDSIGTRLEKSKRVDTEKKIEFYIDGIKILARPDIIFYYDDHIEIYDYKSSYNTSIQRTFQKQLSIYAYPFLPLPVEIYVWFVRYNQIKLIERFEDLDKLKLESMIRREIKRVLKWVKEGKEHAEPSSYCLYCPYSISCPLMSEVAIKNEKEAQKLAEQLIILEAKKKQIEKILKVYCGHYGNIEVNDKIVGYHETESLSIDVEGVLDYIQKVRPELKQELVTINTTRFKKLAKQDTTLTNYAEIQLKPRWGIRKKDE